MATKTQKPEGASAPMQKGRDRGLSANGWRPGKAMTEDEFLTAVAKFNNSPMNGRKSKEARK